ncbi:MAG: glutamine--fructose-6-phosphate aminotransferase, partial [Deltaproteobacteria bacterium]|nr:glutamine--fructose-6-phosphate aminotransferase [Deltaproteobacteria bacterium]
MINDTKRKGFRIDLFTELGHRLRSIFRIKLYVGKSPGNVPDNALILFPYQPHKLCCGLAGVLTVKRPAKTVPPVSLAIVDDLVKQLTQNTLAACPEPSRKMAKDYLGGDAHIDDFLKTIYQLKNDQPFTAIFSDTAQQQQLSKIAEQLAALITSETDAFSEIMGRLDAHDVDIISRRLETLRDIQWCITIEVLSNVTKINDLTTHGTEPLQPHEIIIFKKINTVLNNIDRLEVRGRDSAGISLMFTVTDSTCTAFKTVMSERSLSELFESRTDHAILSNNSISLRAGNQGNTSLSFTYKVAAEIGGLGDNVTFLRKTISQDAILRALTAGPIEHHSVAAHTRWASVGAISVANCHPVDNNTLERSSDTTGIIHACLNGDIDNYLKLKKQFEKSSGRLPEEITTDTKIIPLQIQKYITQGQSLSEAFRLAVNDFEGSHAIAMHSDLAPGKLFLAQRGSGQAIFVGLANEHYLPTSEVYGFVEETQQFLRLDGEKIINGKTGPVQGQLFILDQQSGGSLAGISAMFYDGTVLDLTEKDIKHTDITSRDIDRQDYPHYFLKEISESSRSVENTLQNRWKIADDGSYRVNLDEKVMPPELQNALLEKKIKRIFFVGQGTAGVAAHTCADILNYYM